MSAVVINHRPVTSCARLRRGFALAVRMGLILGLAAPLAQARFEPPSFDDEVLPLLQRHCIECHDAEKRKGGLRLDDREMARAGGISGDVLSGGLAESVLHDRISSEDPDWRMPPPPRAPLSEDELDILTRWVEAGSPWPTNDNDESSIHVTGSGPSDASNEGESLVTRWIDPLLRTAGARPRLLLGIVLAALVVELTRRRMRPSANAPRVRHARIARLRPTHFALLALLLLLYNAIESRERLSARYQQLSARRIPTDAEVLQRYVYGSPPRPIRPELPRGLRSTYFRGNCERGPHLEHDGAYRTAVLRLSLTDRDGHPLAPGDALPSAGAAIRLEIDRSPHTAPTMYSNDIMASVFFTPRLIEDGIVSPPASAIKLTTVENDWRWQAIVPLEGVTGPTPRPDALAGILYVYVSPPGDGVTPQQPVLHYGIEYDLHVADGTLQPESDLFLGNLYWSDKFQVPTLPGKLPLREWIDIQPIPELTGDEPDTASKPALQ